MTAKPKDATDKTYPATHEDQGASGADEGITDDTIVYNIQCNQCGRFLPPHTAGEHLNLDIDHPILQCPHDGSSPSVQFTIKCNRCGMYLPQDLLWEPLPLCHPVFRCPHPFSQAPAGNEKCVDLVDAQEMHREHPDTFWAPDEELLARIKPGDCVKVCDGAERFWVTVTAVNGDDIVGIVENMLIGGLLEADFSHGLQLRDRIEFEKRHVFEICDHKNKE
jgi:hypothetical protein